MAEHLDIPQRRRNYSSPEPREEKKPNSINRKNEFLWERIRSKLTEIINTVIESGADLSGPESSDDFRFWFRAVRLIKMNATVEDNLDGKKNDYCLDKVLDHAMEVFRRKSTERYGRAAAVLFGRVHAEGICRENARDLVRTLKPTGAVQGISPHTRRLFRLV
jgi:hypothetical protein